MHYLVCETPGHLTLKEGVIPVPKAGEVLVKIKKVGICGTDIHAFAGNQAFFTYPRILGHELAGEVIDPNGSIHKVNSRVAIVPYLHCSQCTACNSGKTNCCKTLQVYGVHTDGGMQEYFAVREDLLLPAEGLDWDEIAIIEPLCIAYHAVKRANIRRGQTVMVIGCGPIGLGLVLFASHAGATVIASDQNSKRLDLAKTYFGAMQTLIADPQIKSQVSDLTDGQYCDTVFDATGNKQALESGLDFMAHGGSYILVGLYKGNLAIHHPTLHAKEGSILSSRNATKYDFEDVMHILKSKRFPTQHYTSHSLPIYELPEAFRSFTNPEMGVVKAVVSF